MYIHFLFFKFVFVSLDSNLKFFSCRPFYISFVCIPGILPFIVAIVNGASIAVISFILLFDHGNAINFVLGHLWNPSTICYGSPVVFLKFCS